METLKLCFSVEIHGETKLVLVPFTKIRDKQDYPTKLSIKYNVPVTCVTYLGAGDSVEVL